MIPTQTPAYYKKKYITSTLDNYCTLLWKIKWKKKILTNKKQSNEIIDIVCLILKSIWCK